MCVSDDEEDTEEKYDCSNCPFFATNEHELNAHKDIKHKETEKIHSCNACTYTTPILELFKRHQSSVHVEAKFSCNVCGQKFKDKYNIMRHRKAIHEGHAYKCDQCDYSAKW